MTEARLVWDVWRRILTSDALVEAVLNPDSNNLAALDLGAAERAIVADYASTVVATDTNIGMYRRGLVRNALNVLYLVPLTRRLLQTSGLDARAVAADFVRSIHYRDDGAHFWRIAEGFVAYLASLPEMSDPRRQAALSLDKAAIALAQRLGQVPPASWPESSIVAGAVLPNAAYQATTAAVTVCTQFDVTPWLEDPSGFEVDAELEPATMHWLIYLPAAATAHTYAELSARAAHAFTLLSNPKTPSELSSALDLPMTDTIEVIESLTEIGAISSEAHA